MLQMEWMEKKGKPSNVTRENWSKIGRKEKWKVMHQATEVNTEAIPDVTRFLARAREVIDDADRFSTAMTNIFKRLCRYILIFVTTGYVLLDPYIPELENELCHCFLEHWFY